MEKPLLMGITGSVAYGLNTPDSDIDRIGVFAAAPLDILGMNFDRNQSRVRNEPDVTLHELEKFLTLYVKCNPTIVELFFLNEYDIFDPSMVPLKNQRTKMLNSKGVLSAYGGYATDQARRLQRRHKEGKQGFSSDTAKRIGKHGRHCFRLMLQAEQLLKTGSMDVHVGDNRDFLFEVSELAETNVEKFMKLFEDKLAELDRIDSVLPESSQGFEIANEFITKFRLDAIRNFDN